MKTSYCSDMETLISAKRDYVKDYPHQVYWKWRQGFLLICFESRRAFTSDAEKLGGFLRLKAKVQARYQALQFLGCDR